MGTRLYVGNLPYNANETQIQAFIEQAGQRRVTEVKIITDRDTGRPRGFAFVEVSEPQMARTAIAELHGTSFGGRTIVVNEAREPQRGRPLAAARTASRRVHD
jgi:RNA recognition motif-containing protein